VGLSRGFRLHACLSQAGNARMMGAPETFSVHLPCRPEAPAWRRGRLWMRSLTGGVKGVRVPFAPALLRGRAKGVSCILRKGNGPE